jgi:thymidylate synthase (FAD)
MQVELLSITPNAEELIEIAGRVCYQSKPKKDYTIGSFIKTLIKNNHESALEHGYATFKISGVSRALTHQLVRHRLASYSQKSQRYVKEGQFEYVVPEAIEKMEGQIRNQFHLQMQQIQEMYDYWKEMGLKNEDSRAVLPNACCTEIVMSANFRQLRNILRARCDIHAQYEIRELAKEMLRQLYDKCPNVFEDLKVKFLN